jgi:organic radical activating enzyme
MSDWQLEPAYQRPLYVRWHITEWCNYNCGYCFWVTHPRKAPYYRLRHVMRKPNLLGYYLRHNSSHSFDNYSVDDWLAAFRRLAGRRVAVSITGGEPFLDFRNFRLLLTGLDGMGHVEVIRIDTNLSWKVSRFRGVNWRKISLNASYHPTQTTLENFVRSVKEKACAGVRIAMVTFVLDPRQLGEFETVRLAMDDMGVFTNANVFVEVRDLKQCQQAAWVYARYVPVIDARMKSKEFDTRGEPCNFPAFAYELKATGAINVGCFPSRRGNFILGPLPELFAGVTDCPFKNCACLDMYAFLEGIVERGKRLDLMQEYIDQVKTHREFFDSTSCSSAQEQPFARSVSDADTGVGEVPL